MNKIRPRPSWLRVAVRENTDFKLVKAVLARHRLSTVCQESACPNIWECFSRNEATFIIMGSICTRSCHYCRVRTGVPAPLDSGEPDRIAAAVSDLGLKDVVVTSVTRDDLDDGGAAHFVSTVRAIKSVASDCRVEILIPDFQGNWRSLGAVLEASPDSVVHNLETVKRLFPMVRSQADYRLSLTLLRRLARTGQAVKTSLMLGLGESRAEVREALADIAATGVKSITLGQYLAPSNRHWPINRYLRPAEFIGLANYAQRLGFTRVISGPLVRSSYRGSL